jgi:hypothetical protein
MGATTLTSKTIYNILAEKTNFKLNRDKISHEEFESESFGMQELVHYQDQSLSDAFKYSSSMYCDYFTLTVPAGEPYTQLEKMFLMFDQPTWICIAITLSAGLLVIQVINFMSIQIKKFLFGQNNRTPTLNMASIFLNGGQFREPGRNFARYMLIMFVLWSLIIRTCYQSELYKNLQRDMRRPRIKTIDELNEKNFTCLYFQDNEDFPHEVDSGM